MGTELRRPGPARLAGAAWSSSLESRDLPLKSDNCKDDGKGNCHAVSPSGSISPLSPALTQLPAHLHSSAMSPDDLFARQRGRSLQLLLLLWRSLAGSSWMGELCLRRWAGPLANSETSRCLPCPASAAGRPVQSRSVLATSPRDRLRPTLSLDSFGDGSKHTKLQLWAQNSAASETTDIIHAHSLCCHLSASSPVC